MEPRLLAVKSAVPPYVIDQANAAEAARALFAGRRDIDRMMPIFVNTGIDKRHSCVPIDWYLEPHGWADRTKLFVDNAVDLLEQVANKLLAEAGLDKNDIDAIVVASTTGIATPSLDALIVERMQLRRDIKRLPIFGLGCAGGVIGLSRAADMARAMPGARVMFLVSGAAKAQAVWNVLKGPRDVDKFPAQLVAPDHGDVIWLLDKAAASMIS